MRGRFKYLTTPQLRPELFDVESDPAERINIIAEYPDLARQLQQELDRWLATESEAAKWGKPREQR
jgi:hypothetical protein